MKRALLLSSGLSFLVACGHHHAVDIVVSPAPAPDLAPRADQEAHAAAPQGERFGEPLQGVAYKPDQETEFRFPLEAGNCYWFGYASEPSIEKLTFYVWGPRERRIETIRQRADQGVFRHCAAENGVYRVEGKVQYGAGHFALVIYKVAQGAGAAAYGGAPPPPPPVAAPPPAPLPPASTDLAGAVERQALSAAPGARRVGELFASAAPTSDWPTVLEAGKCYWFIGSGEPGAVKQLSLYLWDPQNRRVTENRSESENVLIGSCPTASGMYKLEAKVAHGAGQYKVGVYVK